MGVFDGWIFLGDIPILYKNNRQYSRTRNVEMFYSPESGPTKNLKEVQNDLMGFINADTILVGHGLENDLRLFYKCWCNICLGIAGRSLYWLDDDQDINIKFDVKDIFNSRALQLVHSVVLDTSAVFPHYCGLPYRRSLRSLVSSYLKVSTRAQRSGCII